MISNLLFLINFSLFLTNEALSICENDVARIKVGFESITKELREIYEAGKYSELMNKKKKFKENIKNCCLIIKNEDFKNKILANHSMCNANAENSEKYLLKNILKLYDYDESQSYSEVIDSFSKTMIEDLEYIYTFKFSANLKEKSDKFFTKCNDIIKILDEYLKSLSVDLEKNPDCSMNHDSNVCTRSAEVEYQIPHYIDRNESQRLEKFDLNLKSMSNLITKNTNITEEELILFFRYIFLHQYLITLIDEDNLKQKHESVNNTTTEFKEDLMIHFRSINLSEYTLLELLCLKFIDLSYKKKEFVLEYIEAMMKSYDILSKNSPKNYHFEDQSEKRNILILLESQEKVFNALVKVHKDIKENVSDSKHNYGFIEKESQNFLKKSSVFKTDLERIYG